MTQTFWNSIFIKFYVKANWHWTCIQKKLARKVSFILGYLFVLQMKKILKCFRGFTPKLHQGPAIDLWEIANKKKCDNKIYVIFLSQLFNDVWGRKGLQVKKDFLKQRSWIAK